MFRYGIIIIYYVWNSIFFNLRTQSFVNLRKLSFNITFLLFSLCPPSSGTYDYVVTSHSVFHVSWSHSNFPIFNPISAIFGSSSIFLFESKYILQFINFHFIGVYYLVLIQVCQVFFHDAFRFLYSFNFLLMFWIVFEILILYALSYCLCYSHYWGLNLLFTMPSESCSGGIISLDIL